MALDELGDDGPGDRSVGPEAAVGDARIVAAIRDCLSQTVATRRAAVGLYLEVALPARSRRCSSLAQTGRQPRAPW
ncbi:MAG: hypothetical protein U0168_28830 [Nannocystaceae bacterium]